MEKIFNISLQRTGTQSIHNFLKDVGVNSMHWVGHYGVDEYYDFKNKEDLITKISFLDEKFDAFNDMPYNILFDYYLNKYPDAKFVFITRDFDSWYRSICKFNIYHIKEKNIHNVLGLTKFEKICYSEYITSKIIDGVQLSESQYFEYYSKHYEKVFDTFSGSSNFLSCSINDSNLSKKFLKFIDIESTKKINNVDFLRSRNEF